MAHKMEIIHLATDDKFIDSANYQFDKIYPDRNIFKILVNDNRSQLKYINNLKGVEIVNIRNLVLETFIKEISCSKLIVLHSITPFTTEVIRQCNSNVKFLWLLWGSEIYNEPSEPLGNIFGPKTRRVFKIRTTSNFFINKAKYIYHLVRFKRDYFAKLRAIKKIQYLGALHLEDFDLMQSRKILKSDARYIKYSYYPIEYIFKDIENVTVTNQNILIGNSAYPSNNHLEIFEILGKMNIQGRRIIAPLNYGDREYMDHIVTVGAEKFGESFEPITEFLHIEDYYAKIKQCGVVIMNNYRQQAVGNILAMIWMGAKVFLDEKNTIYHYLKRLGVIVYSINKELTLSNDGIFDPLKNEEIEYNRKILVQEIGEENLLKNLKEQLDLIINEPI